MFSNCIHGGSREKGTKWLSTPDVFSTLSGQCPGESSTHRHLPYSVHKTLGRWHFDTASEGAYPGLLCVRVVQCLVDALGFSPEPPPVRVADPIHQSRCSRRLMPEFLRVISCNPNNLPSLPHKVLGPSLGGDPRGPFWGHVDAQPFPKTPKPNAGHAPSVASDAPFSGSDDASPVDAGKVDVGIYATPEEYLTKARELVHPIDGDLSVSDWAKRAIFEVLTTQPAVISKRRTDFLKKVLERRAQLEPDEVELHKSMAPHIRRVMKGKKLLLLKTLLIDYGYDDLDVMDELIHGAAMTGEQRVPPYAERRIKPAPSTKEILEAEAKWRTQAIMRRQTPEEDKEILCSLGEKEVGMHFLSGPYRSPDEVTAELGRSDWLANPRFVLYQGTQAKPRVIDDAKSSGLNDTYSSGERLRLQDIDYVALLCLQAGRMSSKHHISVSLSTGETLKGKAAITRPTWKGRTLDLRKAYKQMAVAACDRHLMVLTHEGPDGRLFYISDALPFGARGSVFSFLRSSRALSFLMNVAMMIPSAVFFDDFPSITESLSAASAFDGPHMLLDALGWLYAEDSDKCKPFEFCFDVLGCRLDLTRLTSGNLILANRDGRLESIRSLVEKMKSEDNPRSMIPVVQGHLNFASSFIMGRALQPLARSLSWKQEPAHFEALCDTILATLGKCKPRSLSWHSPHHPVLIFTDAAYEAGVAGIGAVLVDTLGGRPEVFDGELPADLIRHWQASGQQQVISQAELAVVVAMRYLLKERLVRRTVIYFVDNEAARFSLLKGTSGKDSMQQLTAAFHAIDLAFPSVAWVERVPSESNPSDAPSRGRSSECVKTLSGVYAGRIGMPEEVLRAIKSSAGPSTSNARLTMPFDSLVLLPSLAA